MVTLHAGGVNAQDREPETGIRVQEKPGKAGGKKGLFRRMDKNGDGEVTKDEFFAVRRMAKIPEERRERFYGRLDKNDDGVLTRRELRDMRKDRRKKVRQELRRLDADGSGGVDFPEFQEGEMWSRFPEERQRRIFDRMDRNGDGELSPKDRPKRKKGEKKQRPDLE